MYSGQTIVNGVTLPADFNSADVIGKVAISRDRKKYAYVGQDMQLDVHEVPENGIIEVDDIRIALSESGGISVGPRGENAVSARSFSGITMRGVSIGGGISVGSVVIGAVSDRGKAVNQDFEGVSEIIIAARNGELRFNVHDSDLVRVDGEAEEGPQVRDGVLDLGDFAGEIILPKTGVRVAAGTTKGDIVGTVTAAGRIGTEFGDIFLRVSGALTVRMETVSGEVDVRGMTNTADGIFEPPTGEAGDMLALYALQGDVGVRYRAG